MVHHIAIGSDSYRCVHIVHQAEHVLEVGLRGLGLVSASVVRVPVHLRSHLIDGPK